MSERLLQLARRLNHHNIEVQITPAPDGIILFARQPGGHLDEPNRCARESLTHSILWMAEGDVLLPTVEKMIETLCRPET